VLNPKQFSRKKTLSFNRFPTPKKTALLLHRSSSSSIGREREIRERDKREVFFPSFEKEHVRIDSLYI